MSNASSIGAEPNPAFSVRLRDATKAVHREAERTGFVADLIQGRATREGYALYLRNLVPVYAALERGLDVPGRADWTATFVDPALRRLPSLLADLEACAGRDASACPSLDETLSYAAAIDDAAAAGDARLIAHAYSRYLGDLSGGQILRSLLGRHLDLAADEVRFYAFPSIADVDIAKAGLRAALDRVPRDDQDALIEEALGSFRHMIAMSLALARACAEPVG